LSPIEVKCGCECKKNEFLTEDKIEKGSIETLGQEILMDS